MRISLGDVSLFFDVSGPSVVLREDAAVERPVLVALHGGPGLDHTSVKSALEPLAEDFQVLYVDLPASWPQRPQQRRVLEPADVGR